MYDKFMQMLTIQQTAEMLCVKPPTIRKMVREGRLVPVKLSQNHVAFIRGDVEKLILNSRALKGCEGDSNGTELG